MSNAASFSRVQVFKECPARYEWKYLLAGDDLPPGPAAMRGTRIHTSIENYFNYGHPLDPEIPQVVVGWLDDRKDANRIHPELEFAFNYDWEPCGYDDEDTFVRGYIDNVFVYDDMIWAHEYKTGRERDSHAYQKQLYALVLMLLYPNHDTFTVEGVYIDGKMRRPTTYPRALMETLQFAWKRDIEKLSSGIYPARPGGHCRWCSKSKERGGPCPYG